MQLRDCGNHAVCKPGRVSQITQPNLQRETGLGQDVKRSHDHQQLASTSTRVFPQHELRPHC